MIKNSIIIFKYDSLYQIFTEIKNNFSFEIKNYSSEDLDNKDLSNSIILSKFSYKDFLFKKRNMNEKKIIFLLKKNEDPYILAKNQYIFYPNFVLNSKSKF